MALLLKWIALSLVLAPCFSSAAVHTIRRQAREVLRRMPEAVGATQAADHVVVPEVLAKEKQVCSYCCMDHEAQGEKVGPCIDVDACAARGPQRGKYALVLAQEGPHGDGKFLPHLGAMRAQAKAAAPNQVDIVLLVHGDFKLKDHDEWLEANDVKVVKVDWALPPDMLFTRKKDWCGPKDLIRLHALSLAGYDAVAYYDSDVQLQGDVMPVLRCAATGPLLTTNGGVGEPLNVGFFATRPDPRLMQAAKAFARTANFSDKTGWGDSGFLPSGGYYVGMECGQGFMHTLFYMRSSAVAQRALREAKLDEPGQLVAVQIDRCVWNYQTSYQCREGFDCTQVRAHHKPGEFKMGSDPHECQKKVKL
eukprot:TRINITY_DN46439_c0_g1_i1.p1 TRINITY_DN46439_c0_g1~~TRINITY_DN46439_c0_g1_i1.p1  ORF type:complete len:364 (-),score=86.25 TRINITY_DN46439_c0_g1_i1:34-1125(-)